MKFNLSKFKKVHSDKTHTTLKSPEGHEIKIAHNALQPKMRKELGALPAMAEGGEVDEDYAEVQKRQMASSDNGAKVISGPPKSSDPIPGGEDVRPASKPKPKNQGNAKIPGTYKDFEKGAGFAKGGKVPAYADGTPDAPIPDADPISPVAEPQMQSNASDAPQEQAPPQPQIDPNLAAKRALYNQTVIQRASNTPGDPTPSAAAADTTKDVQFGPNGEPPKTFDAQAWDAANKQFTSQQAAQAVTMQQQAAKDAGVNQARIQAGLPPIAPQASQGPAAPAAAPLEPSTMPSATAAPQESMSQSYASIMGQGAQEQEAGINAQADAANKLGQLQAKAYGNAAMAAQQQLNNTQSLQKQVLEDHQRFQQALENTHIDPQRVWHDKSTGGKVLSGIGVLLSGLSGSSTNMAMDNIQRNIDRDIAAQKMDLGTKESLLSHNLEQYRDISTASNITRMQMNDIAGYNINKAAAQSTAPQAEANRLLAIGKLHQQNALYLSQIKAPGAGQGGSMDDMLNVMRIADPARAKEIESRYIPGVGMAQVPIDQSNRDLITNRKLLGDNINELMKFSQKYGGSLEGISDPKVRAYGEALAKQVQDQYRRANAQGVFKPAEAEFVNGVVADSPSSLFAKFTKQPAYKAAAQINSANLNAVYRSLGITPMGGSTASPSSFVPKTFRPVK